MIKAPFSDKEVKSLNAFQQYKYAHSFTCEKCGNDLKATNHGWFCLTMDCDYTQDWAHELMIQFDKLGGKHNETSICSEDFQKHKFTGYMDPIDLFYEEGQPIEGGIIFSSTENLAKHNKHIDDCGIVKVEVKFVEWVKKPQDETIKRVCPEDGKQIKWEKED